MLKTKRKRIFISTKMLAAHDFHKLLRVLKRMGFDSIDILERLHQRKAALVKSMSGLLGFAVILYFATPSSETAFSLDTPYIEIEVPRVMVILLTSVCWCSGILAYVSYSMYDRYIIVVKASLYKNASWPLLDRLYDGDSAWIDPTLVGWNFFKSSKLQAMLMSLSIMVVFLPILLIGWLILSVSMKFLVSGLLDGSLIGNNMAAAVSAIILLLFPLIYSALLLLPFPVIKNRSYVRWNFLTSIWKPIHGIHPASGKWLDQENSKTAANPKT